MASSSGSTSSSIKKSTIWIGNIDIKATEAQILKLVKPYGKILRYDYVYKLKDAERIPRGYAFVQYDNYVSADEAVKNLNGVQVLSKNLKVQLSNSQAVSSSKSLPLSLSMGSQSTNKSKSKDSAIKALEAKLASLEQTKTDTDFKLAVPGIKNSIRTKPYDRRK